MFVDRTVTRARARAVSYAAMTGAAVRTSSCRWLALLVVVGICFGSAREARAQSLLDLTWDAPSSCPGRAWVLANVQRLVTTMPTQPLRVMAVAREADGRWSVDLEMRGAASGTRTFHAGSCTSVARATALIVALALDPQAATLASDELAKGEASESGRDGERAQSVEAATPPDHAAKLETRGETLSSTTGPSDRGPRPLAFLGATVERGLLPGVALASTVGVGVVWRALRADVRGQLAPSASASLARLPTVGADFSYAALALRGCAGHTTPSLAVYGCASMQGARVAGEGSGATETYRQTAWLTTFLPGILLRVPGRSVLSLEVEVEAVMALTRPEFVIVSRDTSERLYRVPSVGVRGSLAASVRF